MKWGKARKLQRMYATIYNQQSQDCQVRLRGSSSVTCFSFVRNMAATSQCRRQTWQLWYHVTSTTRPQYPSTQRPLWQKTASSHLCSLLNSLQIRPGFDSGVRDGVGDGVQKYFFSYIFQYFPTTGTSDWHGWSVICLKFRDRLVLVLLCLTVLASLCLGLFVNVRSTEWSLLSRKNFALVASCLSLQMCELALSLTTDQVKSSAKQSLSVTKAATQINTILCLYVHMCRVYVR